VVDASVMPDLVCGDIKAPVIISSTPSTAAKAASSSSVTSVPSLAGVSYPS